MLFRKYKVNKLIRAYQDEYAREIPENVFDRETLLELKDVNLADIANDYDALKGYEYYKSPRTLGDEIGGVKPDCTNVIPDKSRYVPSTVDYSRPGFRNGLANSRRKLQYKRFVMSTDFYFYPTRHSNTFKLVAETGYCWKSLDHNVIIGEPTLG